ncbi:cytochrome P450 [Auriscalpium vulgare]|uniref:Cytochrome P450 n=1 Tax=Auriscalpium vulgare TaxID=40419 RepID=A0ACB8RSI6_9AGAM|nr:cytochrome P450 [Auriscalpium vulgare]
MSDAHATSAVTRYLQHRVVTLDVLWRNKALVVGTLFACLVVSITRYIRSPWRHLPPGPGGFPVLGNILQFRDKRWLFFKSKEDYGNVVYLSVAGQPIVVLNSQKAASDLLDRRASIYSDRPRFVMADILSGGLLLVFVRFGDLLRRMRRAGQESLSRTAVKSFHPLQTKEAVLLLAGLLSDPAARAKHFRRSSASMVMSVTYDLPSIDSIEDPNLAKIDALIDRLAKATAPGARLVEMFPWIVYIPRRFAKWKRDAEWHHAQDSMLLEGLLHKVRADLDSGLDRPSLCASLIKENFGLSGKEQAWLAGMMYSAGAETTSGVLMWWTLAMAAHPDVQARAQQELDAVVGRGRLPSFTDLAHLPYIRAIVKEALRWRPVTPFSIPHRLMEDDWYEGMFLPRGTLVLPNLWQCNRDPAVFGPDAALFRPERHLDAGGGAAAGPSETREDGHAAYGFGRRVCLGRHVANDSLFIDIATILWATTVEPVDGGGTSLPVDVETYEDDGLLCRPGHFECVFSPRFPEVASLVAAEVELLDR